MRTGPEERAGAARGAWSPPVLLAHQIEDDPAEFVAGQSGGGWLRMRRLDADGRKGRSDLRRHAICGAAM
jgi:hypothetical protein